MTSKQAQRSDLTSDLKTMAQITDICLDCFGSFWTKWQKKGEERRTFSSTRVVGFAATTIAFDIPFWWRE